MKIIIRRDGGFNRQESFRATSRPSEGTSNKMSGYATTRDHRHSYRLPPEGADLSGLNDCHSRICSDTSVFSRSSVAFSHRRRSSSSRASTNPARPDLGSGLSRLPYPIFRLLPIRLENIATDPTDIRTGIRLLDCTRLRPVDRCRTTVPLLRPLAIRPWVSPERLDLNRLRSWS